MKPFDQISLLEQASALDGAAKVLAAISAAVRSRPQLAGALAGEPFGHSAHPMLVQIPIGAWVSAGWLDCLPRDREIRRGADRHRRRRCVACRRGRNRRLRRARQPRQEGRGGSCGRKHHQPGLPSRLPSRSAERQAASRAVGRLRRNTHALSRWRTRRPPRAPTPRPGESHRTSLESLVRLLVRLAGRDPLVTA